MHTYSVIRSRRRSIALEIRPDQTLLVRAPYYATNTQIRGFVESRESWIDKHLARMEEKNEARRLLPALTPDDIRNLGEKACADIPARIRHFAPVVGVTVGRVTIRNQRTRWGSCSAKGNLNFNCLLMLCPENVRDYVVVHELCHRLEMNHSPRFWTDVEAVLPGYREPKRWLRENGGDLIARMDAGALTSRESSS
ncbi:MAG: SprT family zinc-dependent metalloprotease [Eubacteriales bacterium]